MSRQVVNKILIPTMRSSFSVVIALAILSIACALIAPRHVGKWSRMRPVKRLPVRGISGLYGGSGSGGDGFNGGGSFGSEERDDDDGSDNNSKAKQSGALLFLSKIVDSYSNLLEKYPYRIKILSSGIVGACGDFLIQLFQKQSSNKEFDWRRLIVFSVVAAFYIAPVIHVWFNWLNQLPLPPGLSTFAVAGIQMVRWSTMRNSVTLLCVLTIG